MLVYQGKLRSTEFDVEAIAADIKRVGDGIVYDVFTSYEQFQSSMKQ